MLTVKPAPMIYLAHAISGVEKEPAYAGELAQALTAIGIGLYRPYHYNPWNGSAEHKPADIQALQDVLPAHFSHLAEEAVNRAFNRKPRPPEKLPGCIKGNWSEVEGAQPRLIVATDLYVISRSVAVFIDLATVSAGAAQEQVSAWSVGKPVIGIVPTLHAEHYRLSAFSVHHCAAIYTVEGLFKGLPAIADHFGWNRHGVGIRTLAMSI